MKRILIVESGAGFGGALTSLKTLLLSLDPSRFEAYLLTAYSQGHIMAQDAIRRVEVLPRHRRYGPNSRLEATLRPLLGKRAGNAAFLADQCTTGRRFAGAVADFAREHRIDLIQGNNGILINDAVILGARQAGLPCVIHCRGAEYPSRLGTWLVGNVSRVLAVSGFVAESVQALGFEEERIVLVPEGIDAAAFARDADGGAFRSRHGLPDDMPLVGIVACLVGWKGHDVFLQALSRVLPGRLAGAVVVGGEPDGSSLEEARLQEEAKRLGIADRVWFTGHESDVASAMAACQVVVHASTSPEPFGRVILEAMSLGRPLVATRAGGPLEVVDSGIDGLLIPPGDAQAMASAIERLLDDARLRDRLGRAGLAKVRSRYTLAGHAALVESVWDSLTATPTGMI